MKFPSLSRLAMQSGKAGTKPTGGVSRGPEAFAYALASATISFLHWNSDSIRIRIPDSLLIVDRKESREGRTKRTDVRLSDQTCRNTSTKEFQLRTPREYFQHAPNSEDRVGRDVQWRDVLQEHHMSCTHVHTHVAIGTGTTKMVDCNVGPQGSILEDLALLFLYRKEPLCSALLAPTIASGRETKRLPNHVYCCVIRSSFSSLQHRRRHEMNQHKYNNQTGWLSHDIRRPRAVDGPPNLQ